MLDAALRPGMGAIPHDAGVTFRVWAPNADAVAVAGSFDDWFPGGVSLAREDGGVWAGDVPGARAGDEYRFLIRTQDGETLSRIDPYARAVTSSVGNGIVVASDPVRDDFRRPPWNRLVIYEMHVGTFAREGDAPATFEDAASRLGHLRRLGVNAVQVMPAAEFAGDVSWGYNPAHIFAVEGAYGGPEGLRGFVRAAHAAGIAVILDVVYNHFGPSDLDLWRFDGWSENDKGGIYFYNDWRSATPWGDTRPDYGRPEVRQLIRDNALWWLEEYGIDGLRWDMTLYIRSVRGDADGGDDIADGWSLAQWINGEIAERFPGRITIAEDLRNLAAMTAPTAQGGCGFGAQWDSEFVHPIRATLVAANDEDRHMATVAHALTHHYNGDPYQRVIYTESHDEVANGRARVVHEIAPGDPGDYAAQKRSTLGAALTLTAPGIPMLFQGQEFLQGEWFQDTVPLDWDQTETFRGILRLYRDLIRLRLDHAGVTAGLAGRNIAVHRIDEAAKVVAFHRWAEGGPGDDVVVAASFHREPRAVYRIGFPRPGLWRLRLNTDWTGYSRDFTGLATGDVEAVEAPCDGHPWSAEIALAPWSALVFSQDRA
ncbi:alpha-amylase family glycosyl hydrolase [Amaricoccus sp.]|uniref:alpha-amylase family glycosyl hydrolase n=1 Tax=Amaricoccus sp. TaxID=1872485 RepID=UPI001B799133|nr:alpha-amylase family glycosyl hydrolase [Amaricoccus sp.]MBP7002904.1 alpha amylase C-terminal domain-containing protein [Amaricoccus sp.]